MKNKDIENQKEEQLDRQENAQQNDIETESEKENSSSKEQKQEETPEDKIEAMGEKLKEVNDKYLRLYSEFENYRKRTSKERIDLITNASEEMIKDLLPVVDDFDRALEAMAKTDDEHTKQTLEGVTLIYKKLYSLLERKGLKPINAKGEKFDENLHEAIAQMPAPSEEEKGLVIDETTKGYYLNDKVIRYSKVVVYI